MTHEIDYTDFIERYLQNIMSAEEKRWFEKELEDNPSLQQDIEFHRKVDIVLADRDTLEFKAELELIHEEIANTVQSGKTRIRKFLFAGALTIVLVAFSVSFLSSYNFSNQKLLDMYYHPAEHSSQMRSAEESVELINTAFKYYENKEYSKAITMFEDILLKDSENIGLNLYTGISYMEIERFDAANDKFNAIISQKPNPFVESATWYLGLCYLHTNERSKAKAAFASLVESNSYYKRDARKILRRL